MIAINVNSIYYSELKAQPVAAEYQYSKDDHADQLCRQTRAIITNIALV